MLDTPALLSHPSLADPRIREKYCYLAHKESKNISEHGTAVTSIIGAKANDAYPDFLGVAPKAVVATFGVPEKACGLRILEEAPVPGEVLPISSLTRPNPMNKPGYRP